MTFTIHGAWPLTCLDIARLVMSFPPHTHIDVFDIDLEAGTHRYIVR